MKSIILHADELRSLLSTGRCEVRRSAKIGFRISDDGLWMENGTAFLRRVNGHVFTDEQLLSAMAAKFSTIGSLGEVRLVKEAWNVMLPQYKDWPLEKQRECLILRAMHANPDECVWRSAATMPRWASRMSVRVASVSVERVDNVWWWVGEVEQCL